jgi:phosphoribosyl 1,2-cyclic phosphate phosphodiesterase
MGIPMIACDCAVCKSADPKDKRSRSSVKIETDQQVIVIDSGPDFRQQMLQSNTLQLDAILYTHEHKDHTAGLDDVRAFNWINHQPVSLYGEKKVLSALKQEFAYAFKEDPYPGVPDLVLHEIGEQPFYFAGIKIIPIRVYHHRMEVLGFRIGDFSYITDASSIPPESMQLLQGTKWLVVNGLRIKEHFSHFNLEQALEVIRQIAPQKAYITHISHHMGLHRQVSEQLPANVFLAWDGLVVDVE